MVRIPDEYQEVEYLESTGTQWIDTGYYIQTEKIKILTDFYTSVTSPERDLIGNQDNSTGRFVIGCYQYKWFAHARSESGKEDNVYSDGFDALKRMYSIKAEYNLETGEKTISANGVKQVGSHTRSIISTKPVQIFANGVNGNLFGCKCYLLKLFDDDDIAINLIPCYRKSDSKPGMYDAVSGTFYTNSGTGEFLVGNNVYYDTTNLLESRRRILLTTPHLESPTPANPLTFKSNMTTKLKEGKVYFTPIQEGTGDPSPDNVRPISGWDSITVTKCGKNLVDVEDMKDTYPWSATTYKSYAIYVGSNRKVTVSIGSLPPTGKSFYFGISGTTRNSSAMTWMYHKTVSGSNAQSRTVTTSSKGYVYLTLYAQNTEGLNDFYTYILDNDFQAEFGEEATSYEPYIVPTTITIPFPKTIYGGYVDLVNGEVVEELYYYDFAIETPIWSSTPTNPDIQYFAPSPEMKSGYLTDTNQTFSSALKKVINNALGVGVRFGANNRTVYFYNMSEIDGITTGTDVLTWINDNNLVIVYPLATPIHHTIDPQVIRPLKGVNNIWSDANGNIEIKFWKH